MLEKVECELSQAQTSSTQKLKEIWRNNLRTCQRKASNMLRNTNLFVSIPPQSNYNSMHQYQQSCQFIWLSIINWEIQNIVNQFVCRWNTKYCQFPFPVPVSAILQRILGESIVDRNVSIHNYTEYFCMVFWILLFIGIFPMFSLFLKIVFGRDSWS